MAHSAVNYMIVFDSIGTKREMALSHLPLLRYRPFLTLR